MNNAIRYLFLALGILMSPLLLALLFLIPSTPVSLSGVVYLLSYLLVVIGLISAPWMAKQSRFFMISGGVLGLAIVAFRMLFVQTGTQLTILTMPDQTKVRWMNRMFDEQDVVLFGAQIGPYLRLISPTEKESLVSAFSQTYEDMNAYGTTPISPFLATYSGQQRTDRFDLVIAEPKVESFPRNAIIFLHGFGGNFTVQCWLIAKPGLEIEAATICPSTDPTGRWWTSQGESILQQSITYLQQRGVERIYLAGLSNGAIGASRLAEKFKDQITALILISGADPSATITDLPVLILHGKQDERIPVTIMEQYVTAAGGNATYHLFEGDHFLLLKQAEQVQEAIADWLLQQEAAAHR